MVGRNMRILLMGGSKVLKREWKEIRRRPKYWGIKFLKQVSAIVIACMVINLITQTSLLHDAGTIVLISLIGGILALFSETKKYLQLSNKR